MQQRYCIGIFTDGQILQQIDQNTRFLKIRQTVYTIPVFTDDMLQP